MATWDRRSVNTHAVGVNAHKMRPSSLSGLVPTSRRGSLQTSGEDAIFNGPLVLQEVKGKARVNPSGWVERYVVLLPTELRWFDMAALDAREAIHQVDGRSLGSLSITGDLEVARDADPSTGKPWTFSLDLDGRILYAQARGPNVRADWNAHFKYMVRNRRREQEGQRFIPENVELPEAAQLHICEEPSATRSIVGVALSSARSSLDVSGRTASMCRGGRLPGLSLSGRKASIQEESSRGAATRPAAISELDPEAAAEAAAARADGSGRRKRSFLQREEEQEVAALAVAAGVWQASLEAIEKDITALELASELVDAVVVAAVVHAAQWQAASELAARALRDLLATLVATELIAQVVSVVVEEVDAEAAKAVDAARAAEAARGAAKAAAIAPEQVELRDCIAESRARGKPRKKGAGWRRLFCCSSAPEEPEE